jgi:cyclophilin family peptidyl-prolyl cis-trans isomerase
VPSDKRARQRAARQQKMAEIQKRKARRKAVRRSVGLVFVVGVVVLIVALLANGNGKPSASHGTTSSSSTTSTSTSTSVAQGAPPSAPPQTGGTLSSWTCPKTDGSSPHILHFPKTQPPMCIDPAKTYTVTMTTNEGDITFTLDTKHTPKTADNFVVLSLYHYYDGSSIDRIDPSIDILQGGSPTTQTIADPGPGYTIQDEGSGYKYSPGDIVMARGSAPNSASAQYFFVYGPAASALDSQGTYVTFGHVTGKSLSVLQKIAGLYEACPSTDQSCLGGAPKSVVLITKVTVTSS